MFNKFGKRLFVLFFCAALSVPVYANSHIDELAEEISNIIRNNWGIEYMLHITADGTTVYMLTPISEPPRQQDTAESPWSSPAPSPAPSSFPGTAGGKQTGRGTTPGRNTEPSGSMSNQPPGGNPKVVYHNPQRYQPQAATHGDAVMMFIEMASLWQDEESGAALGQNNSGFHETLIETAASHGIILPDMDGGFSPERLLTWGDLNIYLEHVFHLPEYVTIGHNNPEQTVSRDELAQVAVFLEGTMSKDLQTLPYGGQLLPSNR
jgi:hypothetical protein